MLYRTPLDVLARCWAEYCRMKQRQAYTRNISPEKHEIKGRIVGGTDLAIKFLIDGWAEPVWLPRSQVHSVHREFPTTGYDRLIISAWIAKKKEII